MIIEFAITNFRSFRERQVISLLPSGKIRERQIVPIKYDNYKDLIILPTAVLFGANNSGKSNFLRAIRTLRLLVTNSGNFNSDKKLAANEFFKFDTNTQNEPTTFEVDFIAPTKKRYIYLIKLNSTSVLKEELYFYNISPKNKITINTLYIRDKQDIKFTALKGVKESVKFGENQLFLSRADIAGNNEMKDVYSFFAEHLVTIQMAETEYTSFLTNQYAKFINENKDSKIFKLIEIILKETDTGILGLETGLSDVDKISFRGSLSQNIKDKIFEQLKYEIKTKHKLFKGNEEVGQYTISLKEESTGTRKLLGLLPLVLIALQEGSTLLIDEMNTSLHTEMTSWIIDLFNNKKTNPNNAQLINTTHDIALLDRTLYEKDQVFVLEKNSFGATEMLSFADFTGLRKEKQISDYYETGRLGGVPNITKSYLEHEIIEHLKNGKTKEE